MIINRFILENVGIYSGINEFNLKPSSFTKNIILIGGKNGGGKTTFFNSLKLCLYGINAFDKIMNKHNYESYLKSKIHKNPSLGINKNYASISIEFEHSHQSVKDIYFIKRTWEINYKNQIDEKFEVKKNNKELKDLDNDTWQDFINDLIPKGLIELFFFDGEKIQNLVDDSSDAKELSDSFKALLGLEVVEKLKSDLEIYHIRQLKIENKAGLGVELDKKEIELNKFENELERFKQDISSIVNSEQKVIDEIVKIETKIQNEGGKFAKKREELKINITEYETRINELENKFKLDCSLELPLILAKKSISKLKVTLEKEDENNRYELANQILSEKYIEIDKKLNKKIDSKILTQIKSILELNYSKVKIIHGLSESDKLNIFNLINNLKNNENKYNDFTNEHNVLSKKLHLAQKELSYAPSDEAISPYIKSLNELNHKLGSEQNNKTSIQAKISEIEIKKTAVLKEIEKIKLELKSNRKFDQKLERLEKVKNILDEYHNKLNLVKIKEFCNEFITIYNIISRKKDKFDLIEINPKTFEVTLIKMDKDEQIRTPKKDLSEGEKQMYALAVLWTLTKISRRPLPFIIDTPLGRLDHTHRKKLVENFFPNISKQLIILSTDSEIDEKYFDMLKPSITRNYILDEVDGSTKVKEGYFF